MGTNFDELLEGEVLGLGVDEMDGVGVHSSELSDNRTVILEPSFSAEEETDWQESYVVSSSSMVKEVVFPETVSAVASRMEVVTLVFSP